MQVEPEPGNAFIDIRLNRGNGQGSRSIKAATRSQMFMAFILFDMRSVLRYVLVLMRKKSLKTSKSKPSKMTLPATKTSSTPSPAAAATEVRVLRVEPPHPDALLREAEEEPSYRDLREYAPVISTLRGKGFSYREIAEWLSERGIDLDHNAVYRLYTRSLSADEAYLEAKETELEDQLEADRNR